MPLINTVEGLAGLMVVCDVRRRLFTIVYFAFPSILLQKRNQTIP